MKKRKNKIINLVKIGLLFFCLFLYNCEKDELIESVKENTTEQEVVSFKKVFKNTINNNDKLISKLEKFKSTTKTVDNNISARGVYNEQYGFIIDTKSANYIEKGNYNSYTFATLQNENEKIKNVLFSLNENREYDSYLVEYDYSFKELETLDKKGLPQKTSMTPIDIKLSSLQGRSASRWVCVYEYELKKFTGCINGYGCGNLEGEDWWRYIVVASSCHTVSYDVSNNGFNQTSNNTATYTTSGTHTNFGGGPTTTPTPPSTIYEGEELFMLNVVKNELSLLWRQEQWLDKNAHVAFSLYPTLKENIFSNKAQLWAKGQIELEMLIQDSKRNWKPSTGIIGNNPNLRYTHSDSDTDRAYFKMTDGSIIVTSGEEQTLTKSGDLINKYRDTAGNSFGQFYYIKLPNQPFAEMLFNPNNLADGLKDLFALAGKELGKNLGRYVLPIEDIKILIDGKDFDGQQVAKWEAAGGILLTVIPGGKALKAVDKIADGVKVWKVVIKNGSKTYTRVVRELSEETLKHFDNYAPDTSDLIKEALKTGKYVDTVINDAAEIIVDVSNKLGRKLSWPEVKALFKRGTDFNKKGVLRHGKSNCEIVLADKKRIDTYLHGEAIISRKATSIDSIKEATWRNYCRELVTKYKVGKLTNSRKRLNQVTLSGKYKLEIPFSNKNATNLERFKQIAKEYGRNDPGNSGGIEIIFLIE